MHVIYMKPYSFGVKPKKTHSFEHIFKLDRPVQETLLEFFIHEIPVKASTLEASDHPNLPSINDLLATGPDPPKAAFVAQEYKHGLSNV